VRFRYDPKSGALYFRVVEGEIEETLELPSPGAYIDVAVDGTVMGLEFLSLQEFIMFATALGGEIEPPESVDVEAYYEAIDLALEIQEGDEAASEVTAFWRREFQRWTDRERSRRP
jgi:uncharacterized protein YuzE